MTIQQRQLVYVGTYTHGMGNKTNRDEGVFVYEFDSSSGALRLLNTVNGIANPSFLAITNDVIYAVDEFGDASSSGVVAVNRAKRTLINTQPTYGAAPCNLTLDPSKRWLLTANYAGGSVTVLPIQVDGSIGAPTQVVQHQGHGVNPDRQEAPHIHCVAFDPAGRYVFVTDLGLDKIYSFKLDTDKGQLIPNDPPWVEAVPGAGPRHLRFHPNQRFLYATNELNQSVAVYAYDADRGSLTPIQTIDMLPPGITGDQRGADVQIASSGRFLYTSNRGIGYDVLCTFAIDADSGKLTLIERVPSGGRTPRNFAFDLSERYLLVAHQDSASLVTFRIDSDSGKITPTGQSVSLPFPVCVKVVPDV